MGVFQTRLTTTIHQTMSLFIPHEINYKAKSAFLAVNSNKIKRHLQNLRVVKEAVLI